MKQNREIKLRILGVMIFTVLQIIIISSFLFSSFKLVNSASSNDTIRLELEIGEAAPLVENVSIENLDLELNLVANSTRKVTCNATVIDYSGDGTIDNVTAILYHEFGGILVEDPDDNNDHYSNLSCSVDTAYGDSSTAYAQCTFEEVWYYANNGTWNCNVTATDEVGLKGTNNDTIYFNELLAVEIPTVMSFGTINVTDVSFENVTSVRNVGNVPLDIVLDGYGDTDGDGLAMNCSLGSTKNISIDFLKFNLTNSTRYVEITNLTYFEANYVNLSDTATAYNFSLESKIIDGSDAASKNDTWWRIYVPAGVAGTCNGFVNFGAMLDG